MKKNYDVTFTGRLTIFVPQADSPEQALQHAKEDIENELGDLFEITEESWSEV